MLARFINAKVCTRCTEANITNVANFLVRSSRFRVSCGQSEAKYETTGAGSQVNAYLGLDGFKTETPLQNRLTLSSEPRLILVMRANAERYEFKVP